ncbi:MAG: GGDEF domain-containing protein, partial [Myxococcota bacterium]
GGLDPTNLILVGLLVAYALVGLALTRRYNSRPTEPDDAGRAAEQLYIQVGLLGLIYNAAFINLALLGVENAMQHLLLITALLSAGAAGVYQHQRGLALTFVLSAIPPQALYYLVIGDHLTALLLVVFVFMMAETTSSLYRDATERLTLTFMLAESKQAAEELCRVDPLTELYNRRGFSEIGDALFAVAQRHHQPLSVLMIDIDHFKAINDTLGHVAGDAVLTQLGGLLESQRRQADVACRFGGEEFVLLLPNTTAECALRAAERLRHAIERLEVPGADRVPLTVSIGVSATVPNDPALTDVIERADAALYDAKQLGRNRTVLHRFRAENVVHLHARQNDRR